MRITDYPKIREKYHQGFDREGTPIEEIVIHQTGGGQSSKALLDWMYDSGRDGYKKGIALFHFLVGAEGEVFEIINPDKWVYHSSSGMHDQKTIGIEILCPDIKNDKEPNGKQYKSLLELIKNLYDIYPITSIVGHGYNKQKYSGGYKYCPGKFDWTKIEKLLTDNNISFKQQNECFYDLEDG